MRNLVTVCSLSAALLTLGLPAFAQEGAAAKTAPAAVGPAEPAPRWPDGHVNLGSAPGKKGYFEVRPGLGGVARGTQIPFQPWAKALYDVRTARGSLDSPLVDCKATPGPSFFNAPGFEIVDVPEQKVVYILDIAGPHSWRVIYMDGRPHPKAEDLRPTFLGHSTGHWEGDTLVIDSVGFNEKQWAFGAYPNTRQMHIVEKISRPGLKTISYEATLDDPGAYTAPWTAKWTITEKTPSKWIEGGEMFEYICEDANR
jgi:hypothetical protein